MFVSDKLLWSAQVRCLSPGAVGACAPASPAPSLSSAGLPPLSLQISLRLTRAHSTQHPTHGAALPPSLRSRRPPSPSHPALPTRQRAKRGHLPCQRLRAARLERRKVAAPRELGPLYDVVRRVRPGAGRAEQLLRKQRHPRRRRAVAAVDPRQLLPAAAGAAGRARQQRGSSVRAPGASYSP